MARKPTGNPNGRPPKDIDWSLFEQLCSIQCTQTEIASFLKLTYDTIQIRVEKQYGDSYSNVYKRFSDGGKCSLRRHQYLLSKTNTAMAIWLGKQWLGQRENNDIELNPEQAKEFAKIMQQISAQQLQRKPEPPSSTEQK
jgi:hypothetical protein